MRILFMGTPEFSVPTLTCLAESKHEVIGVVTQPDKPKGRGGAIQYPPVKTKALELGIPVYQPPRVRAEEFLSVVREMNPDVIVVIAFGQILPQALLDIPKYGCINIHASLLPKYRGAAPIQWVVIDGEKETGITIMQMDAGLDTGDMLKKQVIPIEADETGDSLHDKLMTAGGPLLLETLEELEAGTANPVPQTGESCYAHMLDKAMGDVDWTQGAEVIERLVRGLNSWPCAYSSWNGKTLKIWKASVLPEQAVTASTEDMTSPKTGQILALGDGIYVKTGDGILKIEELQLEGKKRMEAEAFLRGAHMQVGDMLTHK
jgi:methionyl-tRNA formyltransferase